MSHFKIALKLRVGFTLLHFSDTWEKYIGAVKHMFAYFKKICVTRLEGSFV